MSAKTAPGVSSLPHRSSSSSSSGRIGAAALLARAGSADCPAFSCADTLGAESLISPSSANHCHISCCKSNSVVGDAVAHARSRRLERPILDAVQLLGRLVVRRDGLVAPVRLELLDQVAGRHHLDALRAHQLDRAGIDARDIRNGADGRIFHRNRDASRPAASSARIRAAPARRTASSARQADRDCAARWRAPARAARPVAGIR